MRISDEDAARFESFVDSSGGPTACWLWCGCTDSDSYGRFKVGGSVVRAHRVAYLIRHGRIPRGKFILHKCGEHRVDGLDNPRCVNPAHLKAGTAAENGRDRARRSKRRPGMPRAAVRQAARLRNAGKSWSAIARAVGFQKATVKLALTGERPGRLSPIDPATIARAAGMRKAGVRWVDVVAELGWSQGSLRRAINRLAA